MHIQVLLLATLLVCGSLSSPVYPPNYGPPPVAPQFSPGHPTPRLMVMVPIKIMRPTIPSPLSSIPIYPTPPEYNAPQAITQPKTTTSAAVAVAETSSGGSAAASVAVSSAAREASPPSEMSTRELSPSYQFNRPSESQEKSVAEVTESNSAAHKSSAATSSPQPSQVDSSQSELVTILIPITINGTTHTIMGSMPMSSLQAAGLNPNTILADLIKEDDLATSTGSNSDSDATHSTIVPSSRVIYTSEPTDLQDEVSGEESTEDGSNSLSTDDESDDDIMKRDQLPAKPKKSFRRKGSKSRKNRKKSRKEKASRREAYDEVENASDKETRRAFKAASIGMKLKEPKSSDTSQEHPVDNEINIDSNEIGDNSEDGEKKVVYIVNRRAPENASLLKAIESVLQEYSEMFNQGQAADDQETVQAS